MPSPSSSSSSSSASQLAVDYLLDEKYRIVRLIGQGAWATVYEAINLRIQRRVAIKILNADLASNPDLLTRFSREAEAATQIESPFIVSMFDAGTLDDGRPYIVMEFLEGEDLAQRLRRVGKLPEEEVAGYAIHLLSGLADAHAAGVLHRDMKPDNLVIVKVKNGEEILKIVDFGISKPNITRPELLTITKTGVVLGSPVYMSPEQARGASHMDHRSDLYSVGVVLFEALTEHLPHEAPNFNDLMFKIALEDAPDPRTVRPDIEPGMAAIIARALARDPSERYQSAIEFRDAITIWAENRGAPTPRSPYVTSKIRVRATDRHLQLADDLNDPATREDAAAQVALRKTPAEERREALTLKPPKPAAAAAVASEPVILIAPAVPRAAAKTAEADAARITHTQEVAADDEEPPPSRGFAPSTNGNGNGSSTRRLLPHFVGGGALIIAAAIFALGARYRAADPIPQPPTPSATAATATATSPETAISLARPNPTPTPSAASSEIAPSTSGTPVGALLGTPAIRGSAARGPATPSAPPSAPPVASTPPPKASASSTTVEGRTIQTTF